MGALEVRDPHVPTSYDKAIVVPLWAAVITTELGKFRDQHNEKLPQRRDKIPGDNSNASFLEIINLNIRHN